METLKFFKVNQLPTTPVANAIYFVAASSVGTGKEYADTYITSKTGVARKVGNTTMIQEVVADVMSGRSLKIVNDITARDNLDTDDYPFLAIVIDATADASVDDGGAMYVWDPDEGPSGTWKLLVKYDELLDDLHKHANKTVLDEISESQTSPVGDRVLMFRGDYVGPVLVDNDW